MMLREMLRHEQLAKTLLYSDRFFTFPDHIEKTTFGISCDAFANFKETLTRHKSVVAEYLEKNYDRFFTMYKGLLHSPNYVTKRQSLKLLGEILLDRTNFNVMTRYISNEDNLKDMMNLLKDKSKNIQFEAFHVFKVCATRLGIKRADGNTMMLITHLPSSLAGVCCESQEAACRGEHPPAESRASRAISLKLS